MIEKGGDSLFNLTAHWTNHLVLNDQIPHGEEWIGPAAYWQEVVDMVRDHFGGNKLHGVAISNRTTAGIVATCLALIDPDFYVVSVIPGTRSHPSIIRGVQTAGSRLIPVRAQDKLEQSFSSRKYKYGGDYRCQQSIGAN